MRVRRSSDSSRTILIGELYPAAYRPACPDLNSSPKTHNGMLLLPFVSSQPIVSGAPLIEAPHGASWSLRRGHGQERSFARHMMPTRSEQTLVHELRELIAALDRRVPRIEREGERTVAGDAQWLRRAALKRIGEVERSACAQTSRTVAEETA
jgi:hypothetical protein